MNPETTIANSAPRDEVFAFSRWAANPMEWIWRPYLPKGMLTLLGGAAGAGKTFLVAVGFRAG